MQRPALNTIVVIKDSYDSFNYEGILVAETDYAHKYQHGYSVLVTKVLKATNPELIIIGKTCWAPANRYSISEGRELTVAEKILYGISV